MKGIKSLGTLYLLILLLGSRSASAQDYYRGQESLLLEQKQNSKKQSLSFNLLGEGFFKNNEYSGEITKDYTLPGYRCLAFFDYNAPTQRAVNLKLGVENMYYWGASKYPQGLAYRDLPYWSSEGKDYRKFRLRPYFQASIVLDKWAVILGALEGGAKHELIAPLYNPELNLSSDSETGAQIKYKDKRTQADIWIDWQSFIFNNDKHQEAFFYGLKLKRRFAERQKSHWEVSLQSIMAHRGGKTNVVADTVHTWANLALGIEYDQEISILHKQAILKSALYGLTYMQRGGHYPIDKGWGLFLENKLEQKRLATSLNLWYGRNFISPLGSPFAQAITPWDKRIDEKGQSCYLQGKASYALIQKPSYSFGVSTALWFNPLLHDQISSTFELYLSISPQFKLLKTRQSK